MMNTRKLFSRLSCFASGALATCCSLAATPDKPCRPGCVDASTRLECDDSGAPRAVPCPESEEACAEPVCERGHCGFRPAVGAQCGPDGLARCNSGYACLGPALQLTALGQHTCAVADDGKVWCWGDNQGGELGDETMQDRGNPVLVHGLPGRAIGISAGYVHTCALLEGGQAYCWGLNNTGQSDPTSQSVVVSAPKLVKSDVSFTALAAGFGHTCGLTAEGKVYCWGDTSQGQCGVAPLDGFQVPPTEIPGLDHVVSIDTVKNHTCAVRSAEPTLFCWGSNDYLPSGATSAILTHKLGPAAGMQAYSATPVPVDLGARVVDVGMGFESTYAVTEDGSVYAWGYNKRVQLGVETTDVVVPDPTIVMTAPGIPLAGAREVLRSDGSDQCAFVEGLDASGYACWGADDDGELGFGQPGDSQYAKPVKVLPASAFGMVHGENHACAAVSNEDRVDVVCYGKAVLAGIGSSEHDRDLRTATPVVWDPAALTPAPK